jgi:integrase
MMKHTYRLNDLDLRLAEPGRRLPDGDSLYFKRGKRNRPGTGSFELRFWLHARDRWMGLGPYPKVSLAAARKKARAYRKLIDDGIDPIHERRIERIKKRREAKTDIVFKACAEEYIKVHFSGDFYKDPDKAADRMRDAFQLHVYRKIGSFPVRSIDTDLVIEVLTPIWNTKRTTADLVRGRIEDVLAYAKARKYREGDNPAVFFNVEPAMAKRSRKNVKHHASVDYHDIGDFMVQLGLKSTVSALAVEFLILTAGRPGEVAGARWDELSDFEDKKVWVISAERMKRREAHAIPLSDQAVRLLKELKKFADGEYLFSGQKPGTHITVSALEKALREGWGVTPHGFRATFRTWGAECTKHEQWLLEICLAHTVKAAQEARVDPELWKAYQRGKALEKRRPIMEQWADFVISSKSRSSEFVPSAHEQFVPRDITLMRAISLSATDQIEEVDLSDAEPEHDGITASPQPPSQVMPARNSSATGRMSASVLRQKHEALQAGVSQDGPIQPTFPNDLERPKPPLRTVSEPHSNFSQTDRDRRVTLIQMSQDEYEVRQGPRTVGIVSFYNSKTVWGWRFFPRLHGMRPSTKLYRTPEKCLEHRFTIVWIKTLSSFDNIAEVADRP